MEPIYIDVREEDEWNQGHLANAIHLPLSGLYEEVPLTLPKDRPLYLYCARGRRAEIAEKILLPYYPLVQGLKEGFDSLKS